MVAQDRRRLHAAGRRWTGGARVRTLQRRAPGFDAEGRVAGYVSLPLARYADAHGGPSLRSRRAGHGAERAWRHRRGHRQRPAARGRRRRVHLPDRGPAAFRRRRESGPRDQHHQRPATSPPWASRSCAVATSTTRIAQRTRRVMLVNQIAAERFFPGEDPLGRRITFGRRGAGGQAQVDRDRRCRRRCSPQRAVASAGAGGVPAGGSAGRRALLLAGRAFGAGGSAAGVAGAPRAGGSADDAVAGRAHVEPGLTAPSPCAAPWRCCCWTSRSRRCCWRCWGSSGLVLYSTSQRTRELAIRMRWGRLRVASSSSFSAARSRSWDGSRARSRRGAGARPFPLTHMPGVASFDRSSTTLVPALLSRPPCSPASFPPSAPSASARDGAAI